MTISVAQLENNIQSITHHGSGACVTASMAVLRDPATYELLSSEWAAQCRQMVVSLRRVEQEAVSTQNLANAVESLTRTRTGTAGDRLRLKDGERFHPKSWSGNTPLGGFAREVAAWLYVDPKHEAGKLIQRITRGTLRATEPWTDGRRAEDAKNVELDYELAEALANATERAARSTVLKVTQAEPSHGFVAWEGLVDGYARKSSTDPAVALQPILATPSRCKDAKELKEKLTAWSLNVAESEHQFKVIDEAQKTFVMREMMPKDIRRECLTGPRKFDEIMEKLEIIIKEMMADDGPIPMDLGSVGVHDAGMMQSDQVNEQCHDMCAIGWNGYKAGKRWCARCRNDAERPG